VYLEKAEVLTRLGEQSCSWLAFQVERKDLERAGCVLPNDNFTMAQTSRQLQKRLVSELLQLLAILHSTEQSAAATLDMEMVKDYLTSLFSLTLSSAGKAERLNNAECLLIARRVTEYMEAHIGERITMMHLCRLTGKSEWTLRRIFQRIYSISPRACLTVHRLNAVHRKLLQSTAKQTSVTDAALKYGFLHLGRFSAEYKKHFGEYPSKTLARE
jgi:AraC family ethanolamine operon transcriptional activator